MHISLEEELKIHEYIEQGYVMCIKDSRGNLCPGYADWQIEQVLDLLDMLDDVV